MSTYKIISVIEDAKLLSRFKKNAKDLQYRHLLNIADLKQIDDMIKENSCDLLIVQKEALASSEGSKLKLLMRKLELPYLQISADKDNDYLQIPRKKKRELSSSSIELLVETGIQEHTYTQEINIRDKRYRRITDNSSNAILIILDGKIEYSNYVGLTLFKTVHIEDLTEKLLADFVIEEDKEKLESKLEDIYHKKGREESITITIKSLKGTEHKVKLVGSGIEFKNKRAIQLIVEDITENIRSKEILANQDNIIENIFDAVIVMELSGVVKSWNGGAKRIFGLAKGEIVGKHFANTCYNRNEIYFYENFIEPVLKNGNYDFTTEFILEHTKVPKFLQFSLSTVLNYKDDVVGIICYCKDTTKKKISDESLRDSESNLKALFEASKEALFIVDKSYKIIDYNIKADDLVQKHSGKELFPGQLTTDVFKFISKLELTDLFDNALHGITHHLERQVESKSGLNHYQITIFPIFSEAHTNVIKRFCISFYEETERITQAEEIQTLHEDIKPLYDTSIQRFYLVDLDFKVISFNKSAYETMKNEFDIELKKGEDLMKLLPEQHKKYFDADNFAKAKNGEHVIYKDRFVHDDLDYWLEGHMEPVVNDKGEINRVLIWTMDITSKKNAEDALLDSQKKYFALFSKANDAIIIINNETREIVECNEKALDQFGFYRDELLGLDIVKLSPEKQPDGSLSAEKRKKKIEEMKRGAHKTFYWQFRNKRNKKFDAEISLNQVEINNEVLLHAIIRDITIDKNVERKLSETTAKKEGLMGAIDDLLLIVDKEGKYVDCQNKLSPFETKPGKIVNKTINDLFRLKEVKKIRQVFKETFEKKSSNYFTYTLPFFGEKRKFQAKICPYSEKELLVIVKEIPY